MTFICFDCEICISPALAICFHISIKCRLQTLVLALITVTQNTMNKFKFLTPKRTYPDIVFVFLENRHRFGIGNMGAVWSIVVALWGPIRQI